jgi:hypothetical protein
MIFAACSGQCGHAGRKLASSGKMYKFPANPLYHRTAQEELALRQQFWRSRSDDELVEASRMGSCKGEEDRAAILLELRRRSIEPTTSGFGRSGRLERCPEEFALASERSPLSITVDVLLLVMATVLLLPAMYLVFIGKTNLAVGYVVFCGLYFSSSRFWRRYVTDRCGSCGRPAAMEDYDTLSLGFWSAPKFRYKCKCCGETSGWNRDRSPSG